MKKYLLYTFKRFIPFYIISLAIFVSTSLSIFGSISLYTVRYVSEDLSMDYLTISNSGAGGLTIVITFAVLLFLFTAIGPIIANNYRYSLRSADFYNQIGKSNKKVRLINNSIFLISILVSFTAAYILGVIIFALREIGPLSTGQYANDISGDYDLKAIYTPIAYQFIYLLPIYLFLLIGAINNYFISYFLVTRANNPLNSVILLIFGQIILSVGIMTPFWYFGAYYSTALNYSISDFIQLQYLFGVKSGSSISFVSLTCYLFSYLFSGLDFPVSSFMIEDSTQAVALAIAIISLLTYFFVGLLGLRYFLKEKESSGELAGKPIGRDSFMNIIFHIGAGLFGLWSLSVSSIGLSTTIGLSIISFIPSVATYGALYYVFYSLLRRNFRLSVNDLKVLLPVFLTNVTLGIVLQIIAATGNGFTIF